MIKSKIIVLLIIVIILSAINYKKANETSIVRIATTTSIYDTGLLDELEKGFEGKYPYNIEYIVVGSGAAMERGRNGEVDGVFVHSKAAEEKLVLDNISLGRNQIMYNYFQVVGTKELNFIDFTEVIDYIRLNELFVSRGDNSGTHVKELEMWDGNLPTNYIEAGRGMLDTLIMTDELGGYTLTDDATFITNSKNFNLVEVYKNEDLFKNEYSFHLINPNINKYINRNGAKDFLEYLTSEETLDFIAEFGVSEYGKSLYYLSN